MKISKELQNHYQLLLGVHSPWQIYEVNLDVEKKQIEIFINWTQGEKVLCPECNKECTIKDHREERTWRHLDTMQFSTYIKCRVPRSNCDEHGPKTIDVPWSDPDKRFTLLFEKFAIDVLLACSSIKAAKNLLGISWDELHLIQKYAVERGLERRELENVEHVGIDEKSYLKGHKYVSILNDIDNACVLEVVRGRDKEAADKLLQSIPLAQRITVEAVAVDMWEPYRLSIEENFPNADIVHDKFHISGYLGKAVDAVRKQEHKILQKDGFDYLVGTKYLWLTNRKNWTELYIEQYKVLKEITLKTSRAWAIKEAFLSFWNYIYLASAKKYFKQWYFWATHSRLKPVIEAAKTIKRHIENILTYFKHRITNAVAEGLNSKIQNIKSNARGYRNFDNYRIAILFYCGKLELYPQRTR
jgi:transposase